MTQSVPPLRSGITTAVIRLLDTHLLRQDLSGRQIIKPVTHTQEYHSQVVDFATMTLEEQIAFVVPRVDNHGCGIVRSQFGNDIPLMPDLLHAATQTPLGFITSTAALGAWMRSDTASTQLPATESIGILEAFELPGYVNFCLGVSHPDGSVTFGDEPNISVLHDNRHSVETTLADMLGQLDQTGKHTAVHLRARAQGLKGVLEGVLNSTQPSHSVRTVTTLISAAKRGALELIG